MTHDTGHFFSFLAEEKQKKTYQCEKLISRELVILTLII